MSNFYYDFVVNSFSSISHLALTRITEFSEKYDHCYQDILAENYSCPIFFNHLTVYQTFKVIKKQIGVNVFGFGRTRLFFNMTAYKMVNKMLKNTHIL